MAGLEGPVTAVPLDLTPPEPEPPSVLEQLQLTVGLAELHAAINRARPPAEEPDR